MFDDTYVHEVRNETDETKITLHPPLGDGAVA